MEIDEATRAAAARVRKMEGRDGGVTLVMGVLMTTAGVIVTLFGAKPGIGLAIVGALLMLMGWALTSSGKRAEQLRMHGRRGQARVLQAETTHVSKNGRAHMRYSLSVELTEQAPYEAETTMWMNLADVPRAPQGATVAVRVDSTDPRRVLIEMD